jgi:hypothetical protein
MTTLTQNFSNMSKKEAHILIDKYLDIVEDLEDYVAIKNHASGKNPSLSQKETESLFDSLLK